ncbi:B3/B4 domain-containing protein [Pseudonocardia nigra]|uniref:B3/B4 domain-containing protein n=1 Tax=Pseudonocardia nigra TaxID=1921578 RepID=UPI001C5D0ADE|nr:phenylalanine--tRNA ligase beta subunit-related protein [Pseudonocardia nigra]
MQTFRYDDPVVARFPTIHTALVHATGLRNGPSAPDLQQAYGAEQRIAADRLVATPVAQMPSIAAWRRVFAGFGARPTQYRSAAEALLRRVARHGDIPSINTLVDLGNLVSIRHALPVAVLDLAGVAGPITVRFATGSERFTDLGAADSVAPEPGEVVFADRDDVVCARRWCWRQSAQSATGPATVEALVVIEGHHQTADRDVSDALADVVALLATFQPAARVATYRLSAAAPASGAPGRPADRYRSSSASSRRAASVTPNAIITRK